MDVGLKEFFLQIFIEDGFEELGFEIFDVKSILIVEDVIVFLVDEGVFGKQVVVQFYMEILEGIIVEEVGIGDIFSLEDEVVGYVI